MVPIGSSRKTPYLRREVSCGRSGGDMERLSESAALLESGTADASDAASSLEASPSPSNFLYTVRKVTVASFAVAGRARER